MPPAVPVVAAALGVSTAVATVVVVAGAVAATVVAAKVITSSLTGALAPDIGDYTAGQGSASDQARGVLLTKRGTNIDIPVIYGQRRVGGRIIFAETNGSDNKFLYVVYVLGEGEIHKISSIYVDDNKLPNQNPSFGTEHTVSSGRYADRMTFQLFAGTENQSQSSLANGSASWSNKNRRLPGVAYAVFRYEWKKIETQEEADNNPYSGGIPNVQFDVLGKKCYTVKDHGSGQDLSSAYSSLPKSWTVNPADHLLDYLLNPRYGVGLDITEIDAEQFKTAARKLQQKVDYDEDGTQDGPFITGHTVLNTNTRLVDNVKILVQGSRGYLPYSKGRYKLRIDDGGNNIDVTSSSVDSVFAVSESDMMYGVNLIGEQKPQKYNQVIVRYIDPDQNYTEQQVTYTESSDVTADGEDLIGEFFYQSVNNARIAENIARTIYKNSRNQRFIAFTGTPQLLEAEVGDIITVTSSVLKITDQTFKVQKIIINSDGTVGIEAREHTATIYPFVPGSTIVQPAQIFKPSEFSVTPLVQTNPDVPFSVRVPEQNDVLDASHTVTTTVVPLDVNNTPTPAPDLTAQTAVSLFNDYEGYGTITTSAVTGYQETDIHSQFNNFTIVENTEAAFALCEFFVNNPVDTTIDQLRVEIWSTETETLRQVNTYPLRRDLNGPTAITVQGITDTTYFRFKFYNSTADKEFLDGSTGDYGAVTYTNLDGVSESGKNLEAIINGQLQGVDLQTDPNIRRTSHSLI